MELFRKPDNWWQIYKQTSSTFYTSNDASKRVEKKILLGRHGKIAISCLITLKKNTEEMVPVIFYKKLFF